VTFSGAQSHCLPNEICLLNGQPPPVAVVDPATIAMLEDLQTSSGGPEKDGGFSGESFQFKNVFQTIRIRFLVK